MGLLGMHDERLSYEQGFAAANITKLTYALTPRITLAISFLPRATTLEKLAELGASTDILERRLVERRGKEGYAMEDPETTGGPSKVVIPLPKKRENMHEGIGVWCDCCSCEAEPYWAELAEKMGVDLSDFEDGYKPPKREA